MTKKKFFKIAGLMTAMVGMTVAGALLCMGNAAASGPVETSASEVSTYSTIPDWENGEMIDGALWSYEGSICTTPASNDPNNEHEDFLDTELFPYGHLKSCPNCGGEDVFAPAISEYLVTQILRPVHPCQYEYLHQAARGGTTCRGSVFIHNGEEYTIEPTCTTPGETGVRCKDCGAKAVFSEVPATGHNQVVLERVEPTCVRSGKTEGIGCSNCDMIFTAQEIIPATGHDYSVGESVPATQMYCADTKYSCTRCDNYYYSSTGLTQRKAHETTVVSQTASTCVTEGTKRMKCTLCEYSWVESIPTKAHTYPLDGIVTKAATCEEDGVLTFACQICGGAQYTERIPMLGHEIVSIPASEPTCTEVGYSAGSKCARCDKVIVEPLERAALGHAWSAWDDDRVSCDEVGTRTRTCARCQEVEIEEISAGTHTWDFGVITQKPTCTESGVKTYTCVVCGDVQTETVEATGHKGVSVAGVSPTCTESGLTDGLECTLCGIVLEEQKVIPATGHDMDHVRAVEPTETSYGNIEYWRCETCGLYFSDAAGRHEIDEDDTVLDRLPSTGSGETPGGDSSSEDEGMSWWQVTLAVVAGVLFLALVGIVVDKFVIHKEGDSIYDKAVSKVNKNNKR